MRPVPGIRGCCWAPPHRQSAQSAKINCCNYDSLVHIITKWVIIEKWGEFLNRVSSTYSTTAHAVINTGKQVSGSVHPLADRGYWPEKDFLLAWCQPDICLRADMVVTQENTLFSPASVLLTQLTLCFFFVVVFVCLFVSQNKHWIANHKELFSYNLSFKLVGE